MSRIDLQTARLCSAHWEAAKRVIEQGSHRDRGQNNRSDLRKCLGQGPQQSYRPDRDTT